MTGQNNPTVGDWYTYCCHLDLTQIADEQELETVKRELQDDDEELVPQVWKTKEEALIEIRRYFVNALDFCPENQTSLDKIDEMLAAMLRN